MYNIKIVCTIYSQEEGCVLVEDSPQKPLPDQPDNIRSEDTRQQGEGPVGEVGGGQGEGGAQEAPRQQGQ